MCGTHISVVKTHLKRKKTKKQTSLTYIIYYIYIFFTIIFHTKSSIAEPAKETVSAGFQVIRTEGSEFASQEGTNQK